MCRLGGKKTAQFDQEQKDRICVAMDMASEKSCLSFHIHLGLALKISSAAFHRECIAVNDIVPVHSTDPGFFHIFSGLYNIYAWE